MPPRRAGPLTGAARPGLHRGIAVAAGILMLGSLLSRVLGLAREQIVAARFGAGDDIAAFTIADNLQTLLFDLMVSGALQAALIPVLAQVVLAAGLEQSRLRRIGGALVTWVTLAGGLLVVLGMTFAPQIVDGLILISGDAAARGQDTRDLTVRLVRIVMPAAGLLAVGSVMQAMLHGLGAVTAPALATAVRNAAIIVAMALFAGAIGVESMAWGTLAGAALIVLLQLWPLHRHGALPVPNRDLGNPAVRRIGVLYLPVFLGLLVNAVAVVIDRGLAWGAGELAVGAMRYATTIVQLVLGLVAAALSLAALPMLSRHYGERDEAAFAVTLGRVLGMVTVLILPAAATLAVLAGPVTSLLFGHGATGPDGVDAISLALLGYLAGMVAAAYDQVLTFALYARHNTRVPVLIGVIAVGVYLAAAFALVGRYEMMGLVAANSLMFVARATMLGWAVRRSGVRPAGPELRRTARGAAIASVAMAAAVAVALLALRTVGGPDVGYGASLMAQVAQVAIPAAAGMLVYVAVLQMIGVRELADVVRAVRARFGQVTNRP